jgi:Rps23 Pro-64 3,4-dihydroxylase Tpa1-like proline 4-hydroxylase
MFGLWTQRIDDLKKSFLHAKPFEHVVIPSFFSEDLAKALISEFPDPASSSQRHECKHYDNPLERKYSLNCFEELPIVRRVFAVLQSPEVVSMMKALTDIHDLESDPHLHGAGLHVYPRQGKLDVHLDYSIHPVSGKERRLNLIVYMNSDWKPEYGGNLELWDEDMKKCTEVITPAFNTAVLFRTSDISYHGLPKPIQCPGEECRESVAIYYISPARAEAPLRVKAEFFPLPQQPVDERLATLYALRKERLITEEDLWPNWREDGCGHW